MKSILILGALVGAGSLAVAQNAAVQQTAIQQSQFGMERAASETQPPEKKKVLIEAESEDLGRQVLLEPTRKRPYFRAIVDQQYGYTDNAFLSDKKNTTPSPKIASGIWTSNFFLEGYVPLPEAWNSLTIGINIQETLYRYENGPAELLNFNRDAAGLNVNYNFRNDWLFSAGYTISQLRSTNELINEFYHEGVVQYSALKLFSINPDNLFFAGYVGEFHHATPGTFSRSDNSLVLGYNRQLMPRLVGQLLYKGMAEIYTQDSPNAFGVLEERNDWNNLVSLSFTYSPSDWFSMRLSGTYSTNNSSAEGRDYENLQAGGNLSVNITY